jgi:hypothetical protein
MNAARMECMVTGNRIAMVCQSYLFEQFLGLSYPNESSLSRISEQVAIYIVLAVVQSFQPSL